MVDDLANLEDLYYFYISMNEDPEHETKVMGLGATDKGKIWWIKWSIRILIPIIVFIMFSLFFQWVGSVANDAAKNRSQLQINTEQIKNLQEITPAPDLTKRVDTLEGKKSTSSVKRSHKKPTSKSLWDRVFHP